MSLISERHGLKVWYVLRQHTIGDIVVRTLMLFLISAEDKVIVLRCQKKQDLSMRKFPVSKANGFLNLRF